MPEAGIEPARPLRNREILSLLRLPVSSLGLSQLRALRELLCTANYLLFRAFSASTDRITIASTQEADPRQKN